MTKKSKVISGILVFFSLAMIVVSASDVLSNRTLMDSRFTPYNRDAYFADGKETITNYGYKWENKNWMSQIPDNARVTTLSIPGTHDTMAHTMKYSGLAGLRPEKVFAQQMVLTTQLNSGVRFLDMRAKIRDDALGMYHGIANLDSYFHEALADIETFLANNPSEFILMRMKNEGNDSWQSFEAMFTRYFEHKRWGKLFYKKSANSNTTVGEVRGKIVLMQDFDASTRFEGFPYIYSDAPGYSSNQIQDDYNAKDNDDSIYQKVKKVVNHLDKAATKGNVQRPFFINYLSASGSEALDNAYPWKFASGFSARRLPDRKVSGISAEPSSAYPLWPLVDSASGRRYRIGTNMVAAEYIKVNRLYNVGIIVADFPGIDLINSVINANHFKYDDTTNLYVKYNSSGGTEVIDNKSYKKRDKTKVSDTIPRKVGYDFAHWSYTANTKNTDFEYRVYKKNFNPGDEIILTDTAYLEAVWKSMPELYTYEFMSENGVVANLPEKATDLQYNQQYTVPSMVPLSPGWKFKGYLMYNHKSPVVVQPGEKVYIEGFGYFLAQWERVGFEVSYSSTSPNTTNLPSKLVKLEPGNVITIDSKIPSSPGKKFLHWKDANNVIYKPGQQFTIPNQNTVFTAVWDELPFKATYIGGENVSNLPIDNNTYHILDTFTVSSQIPLRNGYVFIGWMYDGVRYKPGSTFKVSDHDMVLSAQWIKDDGVSIAIDDSAESAPGLWIYIGD